MKKIKISNRIKILIIFIALITVIGSIFIFELLQKSPTLEYPAKIYFIPPVETFVKKQGSIEFEKIKHQSTLFEGDIIQSTGLTEIIIHRNNLIRLSEGAEIEIIKIGENQNATKIKLHHGQIWVNSYIHPIEIESNQTKVIANNAQININLNKNKLEIKNLNHFSTLEIYDTKKENILNTLVVPSHQKVVIAENNINNNYQALTSKKLKKQLKQSLISKEDIQEDNWITDNLLLDETFNRAETFSIKQIITPGTLWYIPKKGLEVIKYNLILSKEKKETYLKFLIQKRINEAEKLIIDDPNSLEKIQNIFLNLNNHISILKEINNNQTIKIINTEWNKLKNIGLYDNRYLLRQNFKIIKEKYVQTKNSIKLMNNILFLLNNLEDTLSKKDISQQKIITQKIIIELKKMQNETYTYDKLDYIRNISFALMMTYSNYMTLDLLDLHTSISNLQFNATKGNTNSEKKIKQDLQYELIENQLILSNHIIENNQSFELVNNFLNQNKIFQKVTQIPETYAFKTHLVEFAWLIAQKITNHIHSEDTVEGQNFLEYIKHEKKVSNLNSELRKELSQFNFNSIANQENSSILQEQNRLKIMKNFNAINISINPNQIEFILDIPDKITILNVKIDDQITLPQISYNLTTDTIFEIQINKNKTKQLVTIKRHDLVKYLENVDEKQSTNSIISGKLEAVPMKTFEPEDEIEKLLKQIIQKELSYVNIEIPTHNIKLFDKDGEIAQIRRAQLTNTNIIFDFTYIRENKTAKDITLITTDQDIEFNEIINISNINEPLTTKYEDIRHLKNVREQVITMFNEKRLELTKNKINFTDSEYTLFEFKDILDKNYELKVSGIFNISQEIFEKVTIKNKEYKKINFTNLEKILRETFVKELLILHGLTIQKETEIIDSATNINRVLIKNVISGDHIIRFTLDLITFNASNILIDDEIDLSLPETDLAELSSIIEETIANIMAEEKATEDAKTGSGQTSTGSIIEENEVESENGQGGSIDSGLFQSIDDYFD